MKATWNGVVLAESDNTVVLEGNAYFPPDSLHTQYFTQSAHTSVCPWKGVASYYNLNVGDDVNENAAWFYPETSEKAASIKGHVAFWKGVTVE